MANWRFSLFTDLFADQPLVEVIPRLRSCGVRAIELNCAWNWRPHVDLLAPDFRREVEAIARVCRAQEIAISAVAAYPDLAALSEEEREQAVAYCLRGIEACQELESAYLTAMFGGSNLLPEQPQREAFARSMDAICPAAERAGVRIAVEVYPGSFVEDSSAALASLTALGYANVDYLLCVPHVASLGEDPIVAWHTFRDQIGYLHVADTLIGTTEHRHLLPGLGEIPVAAFLAALDRDGYRGWAAFQIYSHQDQPWQALADLVAFVQEQEGAL